MLAVRLAAGLVSALILTGSGFAWVQYRSLEGGLHRSSALAGGKVSPHGDTNLLIMGLDSRLDENGNALPPAIYDALHAGDSSSGGENANVLMLVHVPGDGSRATSISIPRDDYVDFPGCPDQQCKGKIKQAYGLAFDAASKQLIRQSGLSREQRIQAQRDAARKAEIAAVSQFLGGVPVDHFVEVTLVAFFQIAQVVQPITVCLAEDTQDSYSGANFRAGRQQINAAQALSFVRQRRDNVHPQLNFTDLDRERRQQAFISSLAYQLKQGGTLTNPGQLQGILNVAKQNIAVDSGLDLLSFAQQASNLTSGNVSFVTLPVDHFGKDPIGEDVNIVNLPQIQALVHQLLTGGPPAAPSAARAAPTNSPPTVTVDVLNATGRAGLAGQLQQALLARGYPAGSLGNDSRHLTHTLVDYGSGESAAASVLAGLLGGAGTQPDTTLPPGHLRVLIGTDITLPPARPPAAPKASSAAGSGATASDTSTGTVNALAGGGIPCVK